MKSVRPIDEEFDVTKTFADDAVHKYIEFATPNAKSELREQSTLVIKGANWTHMGAFIHFTNVFCTPLPAW